MKKTYLVRYVYETELEYFNKVHADNEEEAKELAVLRFNEWNEDEQKHKNAPPKRLLDLGMVEISVRETK